MILPLLLLLAAPPPITLIDEVVTVPRGEWRSLPVLLLKQPGTVEAAFRAAHGPASVRLALLTKEEAEELRKGAMHTEIAATEQNSQARLSVPVHTLGEYELIVDNRDGHHAVELQLMVRLAFDEALQVRYASKQRRTAVVLASAAFFVAVAGFAGARLRRALENRP